MKQSLNIFSKEYQNELKSKWEKGITAVWGEGSSMIPWEMKQITYIVPICGGKYMIELTKPQIITDFYFGYSDMGQGPSYDENNKNMNTVRFMIEDYFKEQNLGDIDRMIKHLQEIISGKSSLKAHHYVHYYHSPEDTPIHGLNLWDPWHGSGVSTESWELDINDVKLILEAYKLQREKFEKRLNTYLKKYGTKNLRVSSYWIDR